MVDGKARLLDPLDKQCQCRCEGIQHDWKGVLGQLILLEGCMPEVHAAIVDRLLQDVLERGDIH